MNQIPLHGVAFSITLASYSTLKLNGGLEVALMSPRGPLHNIKEVLLNGSVRNKMHHHDHQWLTDGTDSSHSVLDLAHFSTPLSIIVGYQE